MKNSFVFLIIALLFTNCRIDKLHTNNKFILYSFDTLDYKGFWCDNFIHKVNDTIISYEDPFGHFILSRSKPHDTGKYEYYYGMPRRNNIFIVRKKKMSLYFDYLPDSLDERLLRNRPQEYRRYPLKKNDTCFFSRQNLPDDGGIALIPTYSLYIKDTTLKIVGKKVRCWEFADYWSGQINYVYIVKSNFLPALTRFVGHSDLAWDAGQPEDQDTIINEKIQCIMDDEIPAPRRW